MIFLKNITFPSDDAESDFIWGVPETVFASFYPFRTLAANGLTRLDFEPVTILYGNNGSGKSTTLNVIAEKIGAARDAVFNRTNFFADYVNMCEAEIFADSAETRIITSDDVFDYMLNIRNLNEGIDGRREEIFEEYLGAKYAKMQMKSMDDYERLKTIVAARSKTKSKYTRDEMPGNVREFSNGESAYKFFTEKIGDNGLYILDEPENSLSPARQAELGQFIEDAARFFGCQIILSTHSPFLLAIRGAKIYDLDNRAAVKKWTELENIRLFRDFFEARRGEFL